MNTFSHEALFAAWTAEYNYPFAGWDFSHLAGRRETIRPADTWSYNDTVAAEMKKVSSLLDMDTGGGELLFSFQPLPMHTCATEGYTPNVVLARQCLEPLEVKVYEVSDPAQLPFDDGEFELIINRHGAYTPPEVKRVLKIGGKFITQQVGGQTNLRLHELLDERQGAQWNSGSKQDSRWNLAVATQGLQAVGFQIMEGREEFHITRYHDVGAIVYYLKAVAWEVPDFSVEKYFDKLLNVHRMIQTDGYLDVPFHLFFIVARKP